MEMRLEREPSTDGATIGRLFVNGALRAFTLEDVVRDGPKVIHETAIPAGRYRVTITMSQRFGRMLPLVNDVPGFTGIRFHSGNFAGDTSGCILVGMNRGRASLLSSRVAMDWLQPQIAAALARGDEVWLTVVNPTKEHELRA